MFKILNNISFFITKNTEIMKLAREAKTRPIPAPPSLIKLDSFRAVWEINAPGQEHRFMSAKYSRDDNSFLVMVDTEAFYQAWLKSSKSFQEESRGADCILRSEMSNDYKYKWAVQGFSGGIDNPVPLAEAFAGMWRNSIDVGFTNGVTRTFWLTVNRAPSFPVQVRGQESAELLNRIAGLGTAPMPFMELFS